MSPQLDLELKQQQQDTGTTVDWVRRPTQAGRLPYLRPMALHRWLDLHRLEGQHPSCQYRNAKLALILGGRSWEL